MKSYEHCVFTAYSLKLTENHMHMISIMVARTAYTFILLYL
jgi:hypothetical protein